MGKQIATCGHEVKDGGIAFSLNGFTRHGLPCSNYKTYCAKCTFEMLVDWNEDTSWQYKKTEFGKLLEMIEDKLIAQ